MIVKVDQTNFEQEIGAFRGVALLEFWAPWWRPCRDLAPIMEALALRCTGAQLAKVNLDENNNLALRFSVKELPTILVFVHGALKESLSGSLSEELIEAAISRARSTL